MKILLGMSGGLDSTYAAHKLIEIAPELDEKIDNLEEFLDNQNKNIAKVKKYGTI